MSLAQPDLKGKLKLLLRENAGFEYDKLDENVISSMALSPFFSGRMLAITTPDEAFTLYDQACRVPQQTTCDRILNLSGVSIGGPLSFPGM
jgi:hypothetical protein